MQTSSKKRFFKRIGKFILVPFSFFMISYLFVFLLITPIIGFIGGSLDIFLLAKPPVFDSAVKLDANLIETNDTATEIKSSEIDYPSIGEQYGEIVISDLSIQVPVFFGDTPEILRYGAGQYTGSVFIGEKGTTIIGDHNGNQFGKLLTAESGMIVEVSTTYAKYQYKIIAKVIRNENDALVGELLKQRQASILLLYTCYPVDSLGLTDDRIFVTCEYLSGPLINEEE